MDLMDSWDMKKIRIFAFGICLLLIKFAAADQMVGRPYDGEVQECYAARQNISTNPTIQSLHSEISKICSEKGGLKVAYKMEKLNYSEVNTITFICFKEINSSLSPMFGCRYYLTGFSM